MGYADRVLVELLRRLETAGRLNRTLLVRPEKKTSRVCWGTSSRYT